MEVDVKGCPMIRMGEWVSVSSSTGLLIFFSCVLHLSHAVICTSFININPAVPIPKGVIFCMQNYKCLEWFAIVDGFQ